MHSIPMVALIGLLFKYHQFDRILNFPRYEAVEFPCVIFHYKELCSQKISSSTAIIWYFSCYSLHTFFHFSPYYLV